MAKRVATVLWVVLALLPAVAGTGFAPANIADHVEAAATRCPLGGRGSGAWSTGIPEMLRKYPGGFYQVIDYSDGAQIFSTLPNTFRAFRAESLDEMRQIIARAKADGIPYEALAYDLEGWDQTPQWEREHQVEATKMARDIAHNAGKKLIMAPARAFTWRNWPKMAPYADGWVIQAQAGQRQCPANKQFYTWLKGYVNMLRPYNPKMKIWAQLSTVPEQPLTLSGYLAYVKLVYPSLVNGVYVFNPNAHLRPADIWPKVCGP